MDKYYHDGVPHLIREKGSFWWKVILRLNYQYRGVAKCSPYKGDTMSFWDDMILDSIFSIKYPNLYSFAKDYVICKSVREQECMADLFRIPMTREAHNELLLIVEDLQELNTSNQERNDQWNFIWGHQTYSVKRFCKHFFEAIEPPVTVLWI